MRCRPTLALLSLVALVFSFGCAKDSVDSAGPAGVAKAKTFKWKLVTSWPKNYPVLGTTPEQIAKTIDEMSNGRLKIKVYGAGELVPALEVFDTVSAGTAEMGHSAAYYWKGKVPEAQFFATVPFGFTAQEMNSWLYYGGGIQLWEETYKPFNLIPLAAGNSGVQMGGWFNREINSAEDLQGLKMRIPGLGGEVLKRAGGLPVTLPGGEIFTALQTGAIDATEWVGPYNDLSSGFFKAAKYYYYPGWHEPGATLELMVNKEAMESLPADLQAIVRVAARAANQNMLDEFTARNASALKTLVDEHGVQMRAFPTDVLKELQRVSKEVVEEEAQASELGKRIHASFTTFQTDITHYHDLTERAYTNAR